MIFKGTVLSVTQMLRQEEAPRGRGLVAVVPDGPRHTAASNAGAAGALLAGPGGADECWRFVVLQTLDDYTSSLRRGGTRLARRVFDDEPAPTGSSELDAALAALADHLAERDGWAPPPWVDDPDRTTTAWYPCVPPIFRADADEQSPRAFRRRGILITDRSLARA